MRLSSIQCKGWSQNSQKFDSENFLEVRSSNNLLTNGFHFSQIIGTPPRIYIANYLLFTFLTLLICIFAKWKQKQYVNTVSAPPLPDFFNKLWQQLPFLEFFTYHNTIELYLIHLSQMSTFPVNYYQYFVYRCDSIHSWVGCARKCNSVTEGTCFGNYFDD